MDCQQEEGGAGPAEDPAAQDAQEKGGAAVVGEDQQPLRLLLAAAAGAVQGGGGGSPHGVTAHQPQEQDAAPRAAEPEAAAEHRSQELPQAQRHGPFPEQGGEDKKGEQRGDHAAETQLHSLQSTGGGLSWEGQEEPGPQEEQQRLPFRQQPSKTHNPSSRKLG